MAVTYSKVRFLGVRAKSGFIFEITALRLFGADKVTRLEVGGTISTNITLASGTLGNLLLGSTASVCRFDTSTTGNEGMIEIVLATPVEVRTFYLGSGDTEALFPYFATMEGWNTTTSRWENILVVHPNRSSRVEWVGARNLGYDETATGPATDFFNGTNLPSGVTITEDGTRVVKTGSDDYHMFTGDRVFRNATSYYFELTNTGGFFGFAAQRNAHLPTKYMGRDNGVLGSIGFGPAFNYVNFASLGGGWISYTYVGLGVAPGERIGVQVDLVAMFVRLFRNTSGTPVYTFDMSYFGLGLINDQWVLALSHDSPGTGFDVKFYDKEADFLYPMPQGSVAGMVRLSNTVRLDENDRFTTYSKRLEITTPLSESLTNLGKLRDLSPGLRKRTMTYGGWGYIKATVKVQGTPNYPVARRVVLYQTNSDLPMRDTISDPVTGEYEFKFIEMDKQYYVVVLDTTGSYIVTSSGPMMPKRMPGTEKLPAY